jgi:adenylylsulfate kinase
MSKDLIRHDSKITRADREKRNKHQSFILWFTGLPCAGKSTLAVRLEEVLFDSGLQTYILDGDNIRLDLCSDLKFSAEDRRQNIRRVGEVSKLFVDAGIVVLAAFISPFRSDRDAVRSSVKQGEFIEIYCNAPLKVCEGRDQKGFYKKARNGEIADFTGITAPYEKPEHPEITALTGQDTIDQCVQQIINYLDEKGKLLIKVH